MAPEGGLEVSVAFVFLKKWLTFDEKLVLYIVSKRLP